MATRVRSSITMIVLNGTIWFNIVMPHQNNAYNMPDSGCPVQDAPTGLRFALFAFIFMSQSLDFQKYSNKDDNVATVDVCK